MSFRKIVVVTCPYLSGHFPRALTRVEPINVWNSSKTRYLSNSGNSSNNDGIGKFIRQNYCVFVSRLKYFSGWAILGKIGVPHCKIVKFRRKANRIYYKTGIATVVKAATPIIIGDVLAQTVYPYIFEKGKKKEKDKSMNTNINWCRTSHFALIGGFLIVWLFMIKYKQYNVVLVVVYFSRAYKGPLAKRWNIFWGRRILRYPSGSYLMRTLILDALILTPLIIALYTIGYDYKFINDHRSDKELTQKLRKRYETPFTDMVLFYITTKPTVAFISCYLLPSSMRHFTRRLYSIVFYCFVSRCITHAKLGPEITKRKSTQGKVRRPDGSGGFVCRTIDYIKYKLKENKK